MYRRTTRDLVITVGRAGFGWPAGIRSGQVVDVLIDSSEQGGWFIKTHDSSGRTKPVDRQQMPTSGTPRRSRSPRCSLPTCRSCSCERTGAGSCPLPPRPFSWRAFRCSGGNPRLVDPRPRRRRLSACCRLYDARIKPWSWLRWASTLLVAGLVATWAIARLSGWDVYENAESIRGSVAFWATLALLVERGLLPAMTGQPLRILRPRLFDVVVVAALAAVGVILSVFIDLRSS